MGAVYLGILAALGYGTVIGIIGLVTLWRAGKNYRKTFWGYIAFFMIIPIIVVLGYDFVSQQAEPNIWLVYPLFFMGVMWMSWGFFLSANAKQAKVTPVPQRRHKKDKTKQMLGILAATFGLILWIIGYVKGFPTGETWWLLFSLMAIVLGGNYAIRYR